MDPEPVAGSELQPYVPRLLSDWDTDGAWRQVDGTLVFVDISGFTNLSERLARGGRIGAEELTDVLNRVFGAMLDLAYQRQGSLLKFGGDALLLLFEGSQHAAQATAAAVEMRSALREASRIPTSVGRIPLRMSVGVHSGLVDLFRVGALHRELVVAGPAATTTTAMEQAASAGEILVSPSTRALLPSGSADRPVHGGFRLAHRKAHALPIGVRSRPPVDPGQLADSVPAILREHLMSGRVDSEHRLATVAFVKFLGIDDAIAARGAERAAGELHRLLSLIQGAADDEGVTFLATDVDENGGKVILCVGVRCPGTTTKGGSCEQPGRSPPLHRPSR
jgi:class 3 adenylate cyclase